MLKGMTLRETPTKSHDHPLNTPRQLYAKAELRASVKTLERSVDLPSRYALQRACDISHLTHLLKAVRPAHPHFRLERELTRITLFRAT